ncbi:hypothetical protein P152DRAFT_485556 [Eremomyces bilateralis CBS 781.70]|uniref:DUF676 domain-containing protein n=1 Tax=Eremomyces bilateralis CBS 781.70 TaxID=1392243 RepID=A0A6G1FRG7_9PEZI|nr:uncharacterized protein P152DRAFT_485556 [Eremomyces bilateralis CBS 781.70]KAF1808279.1 hypothetical protein P152DRAFT_485556 [Eremomyces bilateralis CBS 781.70]
MQKTLLLCFIHGFKGDDDTFAGFPAHLRAILSHALPRLNILTIVYPRFETRGDLRETVARFKEWLQNKVIDLEVANGTPSPTVDPSVHVLLVGHSMGGIIGAETLLSISRDQPVSSPTNLSSSKSFSSDPSSFMFPYISGLLAFDTPYLGISPGVVAHGAEKHWTASQTAYNAYNSFSSAFRGSNASAGGGTAEQISAGASTQKAAEGAKLVQAASDANADAARTPAWARWGKVAMFAGAAGAVAATGAAAYMNRGALTSAYSESWSWVSGHLIFVGCLTRGEELRQRMAAVEQEVQTRGVGFSNCYTVLGRGAKNADGWFAAGGGESGDMAKLEDGTERTFVVVPKENGKSGWRKFFIPCVNDAASAEVGAHMAMFTPLTNPGYYEMTQKARELIVAWTLSERGKEWYDEADMPNNGPEKLEEGEIISPDDTAVDGDYEMEFEDVKRTA